MRQMRSIVRDQTGARQDVNIALSHGVVGAAEEGVAGGL